MRLARFTAGVTLCLVLLGGLLPTVLAQAESATEERVVLTVGDIFEILADPGESGASYSWILTQERAFVEASREATFRYRFVQDRIYTLRGEVTLQSGERRQRTFTLEILRQTDVPPLAEPAPGTGATLASTVPGPDINGRIVLTPNEQLVRLTPRTTDISPLALDLDAARDTDADGNPGNDVDNAGTYFHSFGRSLWVWFARPLARTQLVVTGIPAGGTPIVQRIDVLSEEAARNEGVLTSPVTIIASEVDAHTFSFRPTFATPPAADTPLLYEWEFGDGEKSLETTPTHAYAVGGAYAVRLHVRDLQTGNTVGETELSITVAGGAFPPDEPIDEPVTPPDEEPTNGSSLPWGRIIVIGMLFIVSIAIGLGIVWLLSFLLKSRRLEKTLESMEQTIVPAKDATPPPLAIRKPAESAPRTSPNTQAAAQQKVIDAEESAAHTRPTPAPTVSEAAAPDWLKKGLTAAPATAPAPATPATPPAPRPTPPAPIAPPAPKPTPTPVVPPPTATVPAPAPTPDNKVPRWLQQTDTPVAVPTPPTTTPKPAIVPAAPVQPSAPKPMPPPAAPAPAPTPAPKPVPAPVPKPVVVQPPAPRPVPPPPAPTPKPAPVQPPAPPAPKPAVVAPTVPQAPIAPKPIAPPPVAPQPPRPPVAPVPKPMPPVSQPIPQVPAPAPVTPPPAVPMPPTPAPAPAPTPTPAPQNDDEDPPIAIIRAENIGPGPAK